MVTRDRGQLLLVAAVLIALVIVASAVLLNGLVTPETATTSSLSGDAADFERTTDSIASDLEQLFEHNTSVDEAGEPLPYADADALGRAVNDIYGPLVANATLNRTGAVLDVRYARASSLEGDVVYNTSVNTFENEKDSANWTVAQGVETIPRAIVNVSNDGGGEFGLAIEGSAGGEWSYNVTDDAVVIDGDPRCDGVINSSTRDIRLDVRNPAIHNATLEVTNTDGDVPCSPRIEVAKGLSTPYTVSIGNGDQAEGTYFISVDGDLHDNATDDNWVSDEEDVVVNPAFAVSYLTEGIEYKSTYRLYNATR